MQSCSVVASSRLGSLASLRPARQQGQQWTPSRPLRRQQLVCRAEQGTEQQPQQQPAAPATPPPAATPAAPQQAQQQAVDPSVAKGQRTAIVTGAISIIFGVLYLVLVYFLDSRGGEMLPPPPEAYGP